MTIAIIDTTPVKRNDSPLEPIINASELSNAVYFIKWSFVYPFSQQYLKPDAPLLPKFARTKEHTWGKIFHPFT